MVLTPSNLAELREALASAQGFGQEKITAVHIAALNRILEHSPEDMTATVEAGLTLEALQSHLARQAQWLPIDPPHPEKLTIGGLISSNASGPRRFGYGTIRDHLIGMKAVLPDGRLIKAGGKVVKNVAGYDIAKLLVGSHESLGVIVEATFKLQPIPEAEELVQREFESLEQADSFIETILASDLTPTVLDLHNISTLEAGSPNAFAVVLGFAGAREDVEYQLGQARCFGAGKPSSLAYDKAFWMSALSGNVHHLSVLPSTLTRAIRQLGEVTFIARAGNGIVWYRGGPEPAPADLPVNLLERVKNVFDPKHILPELPL
jgi:FAD/FMN-containing dehydrogenase